MSQQQQSYEYSYSSTDGTGGYRVEYSNSSTGGDVLLTSGGNAVISGGDSFSYGASNAGAGNILINSSNSGANAGSFGSSGVFISGGSASGAAGAGAGAGAASSGSVNQITQDLLALAGGAGSAAAGGAGGSSITISYGGSASGAAGAAGAGGAVLEASAFSQLEQAILRANNPVEVSETEVITVNGQTGIWANRQEVLNWRGVIPITQYVINEDANPEIIRKRTEQVVTYEQEVAIRYLRPPTPPPPGEILIRQEKNIITPPAPPLVIRQQPPRPETPAPLVIREAPPRPPAAVGQKVITISGKRLPPPPRKVIIERLAPLPQKPQSIIIERWLPYNQTKRRVILQRHDGADPVIPKPRNVIIQWEAPQVQIKKEFKDLGVIRANPVEYVQRYGASLKSHIELPQFVKEIRPPTGVVLAAEYNAASLYELEGDVQALTLIDLDREGLGEYRSWLARFGSSGSFGAISGSASGSGFASGSAGGAGFASGSAGGAGFSSGSSTVTISGNLNAVLAELFASVDKNASGSISRSEGETLLLKLNSRLGRRYGEDEVNAFFRALDVNGDGLISFAEFRNAILRQFA